MSDLVAAVKRAAVEAVRESQPCGLYVGTVASVDPLAVRMDQRTTLTAAQLTASSLVRDFDVEMTVDHATEPVGDPPHHHGYRGRKRFTVRLGLRPGERVLLLREQGGQHFIILDRLR